MIGDECPSAVRGVFHNRFLPEVASQEIGTDWLVLVPSPRGPRQPGQFSASADGVMQRLTANTSRMREVRVMVIRCPGTE
jgi:hypothetical protein